MLKYNDDHVYYNVLFNNTSDVPQPAFFTETRSSPLIANPSRYHMAIVRFSIPGFDIPLMLWPNNQNGTPNNLFYSFTFSYSGFDYRIYLNYIPWATSTTTNGTSPIYSYQNFIDSTNQALYDAHIYMASNAPGYPGLCPPYVVYDPSAKILSLIADTTYLCQSVSSAGIKIYSNFSLHEFYEPIPHIGVSYNSPTGKDVLFVVEKTGNNNLISNNPIGALVNVGAYSMNSFFNVLNDWGSLKSIIMTSSNMRTKEEYIQTKLSINTDSSQNIITDFEPDRSVVGYTSSWFQYNAQIYRWVDLISNDPLRTVDINLYWTDGLGQLYPIYIPSGKYFTIKILFTLKDSIH